MIYQPTSLSESSFSAAVLITWHPSCFEIQRGFIFFQQHFFQLEHEIQCPKISSLQHLLSFGQPKQPNINFAIMNFLTNVNKLILKKHSAFKKIKKQNKVLFKISPYNCYLFICYTMWLLILYYNFLAKENKFNLMSATTI